MAERRHRRPAVPRVVLIEACVSVALLVAPAQAAEEMGDLGFYFGELHAHTGHSGDGASTDLGNCEDAGCGNFADFFDNAYNLAGLDFCAITDHLNGGARVGDEGWEATLELVGEAYTTYEGTGFLPLMGGEGRLSNDDDMVLGHKNIIFFAELETILAMPYEDVVLPSDLNRCADVESWVRGIDEVHGPVLLIPHHPAATIPMAVDWSCHDEELSPMVEIYSAHGNSRDTPTNDPYDPLVNGVTDESTVNAGLDLDGWGYHLGIIGGTDFHDSWPGLVCHLDVSQDLQPYGGGLTGVFMDSSCDWTRASLHGALRQRHSYATSGPMVPVVLALVDGEGEQLAVSGDILSPPPKDSLSVQLSFPPELQPHVQGVVLHHSLGETWDLPRIEDGVHGMDIERVVAPWYGYAIVTLDGDGYYAEQGIDCTDDLEGADLDERLWTSPIWVEELDTTDDDGDGYSEADGDCDDRDADRSPEATESINCVDDDCDGEVDESDLPIDTGTPPDDTDEHPDDTQGDTEDSSGDSDDSEGDTDDTGGDPNDPDCGCTEVAGVRGCVGGLPFLLGLPMVLVFAWRRREQPGS